MSFEVSASACTNVALMLLALITVIGTPAGASDRAEAALGYHGASIHTIGLAAEWLAGEDEAAAFVELRDDLTGNGHATDFARHHYAERLRRDAIVGHQP